MAQAVGLMGEVIVPSFTFVATAHALSWLGITPVFADITPERHTIDPACIEALITERTTGILPVHVWVRPCDIEALTCIAEKHNLRLIFDAAHAFACTHGDQYIGNFSEAEVFGFHATKFFNTFEGGAIVTNDDGLAHRARSMRNFGFVSYHAAMGLSGLESIKQVVDLNKNHHARYGLGKL